MAILSIILAACGVALFLAGFYTGVWIQRHSREVITREVEKLISTDRVVEVEKPIVVQVPVPMKQKDGGSLVWSKPANKSIITDPKKRAEAEGITSLLNSLPEVES